MAVGNWALGQADFRGVVLNAHFVASALCGLGDHEVPLYVVSVAYPTASLPREGGSSGLYCIVNLRCQHRLAAALFQRDFVTCAVTDVAWPYRLALPVYVQGCTAPVSCAVTAAVVRAVAAARLLAARRALACLLADYYVYAVKCIS